jgi:hypothetical protein
VGAYSAFVTRPQTLAEMVAVIEGYVDDAHRRVLRSTTDPAHGLPRFKRRAEQAQDERVLRVLLALLGGAYPEVLDLDRLQAVSYERIDGAALAVQETRLRRRLQGIPETAPSSVLTESGGLPGLFRFHIYGVVLVSNCSTSTWTLAPGGRRMPEPERHKPSTRRRCPCTAAGGVLV